MTTETHYVVRDATGNLWVEAPTSTMSEGQFVPGLGIAVFVSRDNIDLANHYASRAEAEAVAAQNGGTVQRVTVTTEDVGLRWVQAKDYRFPWEALYDGDSVTDFIVGNHDYTGPQLYHHIGHGAGKGVRFPTPALAKAAAEAAVRETWT
jgi:hypothetical protein